MGCRSFLSSPMTLPHESTQRSEPADKPMSTKPPASEYLLLFRNNAWYQDLAPDVIEESMNQFTAWADELRREGKLKSGGPLEAIGKTLTSTNVVIDGPFAESKEAVAGFFVIQAGSLEEAVEVAKGCPGLEVGQTVEVRAFATDPFENEIAQIDAAREDRSI
jgi:hypothetical protein